MSNITRLQDERDTAVAMLEGANEELRKVEAENKRLLELLVESAKLLADAPRGLRSDAWEVRQQLVGQIKETTNVE